MLRSGLALPLLCNTHATAFPLPTCWLFPCYPLAVLHKAYMHPKYDSWSGAFDVALIHLDTSVGADAPVVPLALPHMVSCGPSSCTFQLCLTPCTLGALLIGEVCQPAALPKLRYMLPLGAEVNPPRCVRLQKLKRGDPLTIMGFGNTPTNDMGSKNLLCEWELGGAAWRAFCSAAPSAPCQR